MRPNPANSNHFQSVLYRFQPKQTSNPFISSQFQSIPANFRSISYQFRPILDQFQPIPIPILDQFQPIPIPIPTNSDQFQFQPIPRIGIGRNWNWCIPNPLNFLLLFRDKFTNLKKIERESEIEMNLVDSNNFFTHIRN